MSKHKVYLTSTIVLTILVLIATLRGGWVTLDDPTYILDNPLIKDISWGNIKLMFTTLQVNGSYNPIVLLSWAIDYHFVELDPSLYHFTNLILHLLVVSLVYYLAFKLSKNKLIAFGTSLLFGIHPMHVEAVAWVTSRKDLLYTLFYIAGLIVYFFYQEKKNTAFKWWYLLLCFVLYLLSLFSKGSAITFPLILWAIDYLKKRQDLKILLLEKIPFLFLSAIFTYISIKAQSAGKALQVRSFYSVIDSLSVGFFGYLDYLIKIFIPYRLSALHPYPTPSGTPVPWYFTASSIPILGLVVYCITKIRSNRTLNFGLGFFFISLIPVIQVLSFAISVTADRFTYLPYFGVFYVISTGVVWIIDNKPKFKNGIIGLSLVYILILSIITFSYSLSWKNSGTLWSRVLKFYPNFSLAYVNRSFYWIENGQLVKALKDCNQAIKLKPDYYLAYYNRGYTYKVMGNYEKALSDYSNAILFKEDFFRGYQNRGILYVKLGKFDEALLDFNKSIKLRPNNALAFLNRASLFEEKGLYDKAIIDASKAISINESLSKAYYLRGKCYQKTGQADKAITDYSRVISYNPSMSLAYTKRGIVFLDKGMLREAIQDFNKAISLDDGQIDAYVYRTLILIRNNRFEEALFSLSRAEKIDPSNYLIYLNRGVIYQKKGDYKTAIKSIDKGLLFKPKDSSLLARRESLERILKTDF